MLRAARAAERLPLLDFKSPQVLEAAIQRMVQDAKSKALAKAATAAAAFVPAPAFHGRRRGYVFSTRR